MILNEIQPSRRGFLRGFLALSAGASLAVAYHPAGFILPPSIIEGPNELWRFAIHGRDGFWFGGAETVSAVRAELLTHAGSGPFRVSCDFNDRLYRALLAYGDEIELVKKLV